MIDEDRDDWGNIIYLLEDHLGNVNEMIKLRRVFMPRIRKFTFGTNAEQFHSHATARKDCIDRLPRSFLQALADELRIEKPNDEGKVA